MIGPPEERAAQPSRVPTVTVRYWAAARAAAGVREDRHQGRDLAEVLAAVRAAHGPELGRVLDRCSYLVDEVRAVPATPLREGSVVDVLPPFAGGSGPSRVRAEAAPRRAASLAHTLPPAALSLALVGVTAVAAGAGGAVLLLPVLLAQVALVAGWFAWCGVPGATGGRVLALAAAVLAGGLLLVRTGPDGVPEVGVLTWVLGPAFVLALLTQLARRDGRPALAASLAATVTVTAIVVLGPVLLAARALDGGERAVLAALTGVAAASVTGLAAPLLPPGARHGATALAALAVAAIAGGAAGAVLDLGDAPGTALALAPALPAAVLPDVAGPVSGPVAVPARAHWLVVAALPLVLLGPSTYLVARLVLG